MRSPQLGCGRSCAVGTATCSNMMAASNSGLYCPLSPDCAPTADQCQGAGGTRTEGSEVSYLPAKIPSIESHSSANDTAVIWATLTPRMARSLVPVAPRVE